MQEKYSLKNNKYCKTRGGSARFLSIYCGTCGKELLLYQKDGPGNLFRLYFDKIAAPADYSKKLSGITNKQQAEGLKCSECKTLIAVPMVYTPENRLALRLIGPIKKVENSQGIFPLGSQKKP